VLNPEVIDIVETEMMMPIFLIGHRKPLELAFENCVVQSYFFEKPLNSDS
jgi:hypothetical protein